MYLVGGNQFGPSDAGLTIVVFGDYECSFCRSFQSVLEFMMEKHPDEIRLIFHHWPLSQHRHAYPAARAAECGPCCTARRNGQIPRPPSRSHATL